MAKVLRVVATVAAVVGLAATGIGLALAPGATFLGASAATLATIGTVAGLTAAVAGLGAGLLARRPTFSAEGNPLQFQTNPQSGLPYPIGRTRFSGLRIHADTYDGSTFESEGKDDVLAFAVMLGAGGEMEEIESFKADKQAVTFAADGNATGSFANYMAQKVSLGVAGASALALAFGGGNFPGWTTDHKLSGIAHALWDLRFDPEGNKYGAGVPVPEWIGKWVKVYDPRLDSTYPGGSGSHRALDESTYEWSENPALHALTWALGRWQNGKRTLGIGAPIDNIRVADFVEAANVADANNWACGGVEWSTDNKWTILKKMLQAGGAEPTMAGAMIGCRVNTPRTSIATVSQEDLLDSLIFPTTKSRRDRFNTVIPRYRSEDHDWEIISGEPIQVASYVTEDGGIRVKEIDFPLVQKQAGSDEGNEQAGHLATYEVVNSRETSGIQFTTGPEFIGIVTGDCITLDVPDHGLDEQPVIVRSRSIDPATLKITFEVETETDAKHAFALGKTAVPPPTYSPTTPDLTPPTPDASLWSLTAEVTGEVLPSLRLTGACEFPGADLVLIQYREDGESDWLTLPPADAGTPVDLYIAGLAGGTAYEVRIAYKSDERLGPWLTLGPVTTATFDLVADFDDLNTDFYAQNNWDASTPTAAAFKTGGDGLDHSLNDDGSADITLEWTYGGSEGNIDGFEVLVYSSTTGTTRTVASVVDAALVTRVPPNRRAFMLLGVPRNLHYTTAIRSFRIVAAEVDANRVKYSAWVKPTYSGEDPYQPSSNIEFDGDLIGDIDGKPVSVVAAVVDESTGNIASGKVVTDSIVDGAINLAGYAEGSGTYVLGYSDDAGTYFLGSEQTCETGDEVEISLKCPYEIITQNPTQGTEYQITFNVVLYYTGGVGSPTTEEFSRNVVMSDKWTPPSTTGTQSFGRRWVEVDEKITVPFPGDFSVGWRARTPAGNYGNIYTRYMKLDVKKALQ